MEEPRSCLHNGSSLSSRFAQSCGSFNSSWPVESFCSHAYKTLCTEEPAKRTPPTAAEVWGYGMLFVLLVSLSSVVGVFFLPLMKRDSYQKVLMGMVGLAVGCLSGSAVLHLIPQAFELPDDEWWEREKFLFKSLVVLAAIYAFFLTERLLKLSVDHRKRVKRDRKLDEIRKGSRSSPDSHLEDPRGSHDNGSSHGHHHHRHGDSEHIHVKIANGSNGDPQLSDDSFDEAKDLQHCGHLHMKAPPPDVKTHAHDHDLDSKDVKEHPIKTVAWMVITGDGIHNFVDGLSMGAAFSESVLSGIALSIAVLCEELPHELGDLAILLNSGMKLKKALMYNFLSACTCFAGLIVGICLGSEPEARFWIFALAGGMFLYISLVDMLPEMTHAAEEASGESVMAGLNMLLIQNIGMLSGFTIMYLLARYSGDIKFE